MPRPLVLLLRAPQDADPYESAVVRAGFDAMSVPVLRFDYLNGGELAARLARPERYAALVLTSLRAVESLARQERLLGPWRSRPVYAVGPATAGALRELGLRPLLKETTAEALAGRIVAQCPAGTLLFLCGDRRRDTLPTVLRDAAIAVEELVVYRTVPVPPLLPPTLAPDWAVFFSPTGVEGALGAPTFPWNRLRTPAIGPTTAEALARVGRQPAVVAEMPTPEALAQALRTA